VHCDKKLSFWNTHYDCRWFLPINVYHMESGKPDDSVRGHDARGARRWVIKHLTRRIRRHFPKTRIA